MEEPITIRKRNPMRKAEIPIIGIFLFYLFIFYAMAAGDLSVMLSELFSIESGIIGLTFAVFGFALSVLLSLLQVSRITLTDDYLVARSRLGMGKKFKMAELEKCFMRWYDTRAGRFPLIQFNFSNNRKIQIQGDQYQGLRPLILYLREHQAELLQETR